MQPGAIDARAAFDKIMAFDTYSIFSKNEVELRRIEKEMNECILIIKSSNGSVLSDTEKGNAGIKKMTIDLSIEQKLQFSHPIETTFLVLGSSIELGTKVACKFNDKITCKAFVEDVRKQLDLPSTAVILIGATVLSDINLGSDPITQYMKSTDFISVFFNKK